MRRPEDDPRLTAFALGELDALSDEERAEVERLLAADPAARRHVEAVRAAAATLEAGLAGLEGEPLPNPQRELVAATAAGAWTRSGDAPNLRGRLRPFVPWMTAAAAAVVVAAFVRGMERPGSSRLGSGSPLTSSEGETLLGSTRGVDIARHYGYGGGGGSGSGRRADVATGERGIVEEARRLQEVPAGGTEAGSGRYRGPHGEVPPASREPADPSSPDVGRSTHHVYTSAYQINLKQDGEASDRDRIVAAIEVIDNRLNSAGVDGVLIQGLPADPASLVVEARRRLDRAVQEGLVTAETARSLVMQLDGTATVTWAADPCLTEQYAPVEDNPFRLVGDAPLSTFAVDVDTASYANVRRMLRAGQLPPPGAVRIEEFVNYFPYDLAPPTDGRPFAVHTEVAGCPWATTHRLVRVSLKGEVLDAERRPPMNLVFLVDVSGSMQPENKLPLLVRSLHRLAERLEARDRVAMVVYAGSSGLVLPSTSGAETATVKAALDRLRAGGSTNGGAGIELAYRTAAENRIEGGVNRVILCTDGDFNVGVTDRSSLVELVKEQAKAGVFLTVLGFGMGNYKDDTLEQLADRGNGNYAYVDSDAEAQKTLVDGMAGTLVTIAKDAKVQVEWNPLAVQSWRLIGYENRLLRAEEFADDRKDGGEIGAGHAVTALFEVVPAGSERPEREAVGLRYQTGPSPTPEAASGEMLVVKLRWKQPDGQVSDLHQVPVRDAGRTYADASPDLKFAGAVAAFGMLLRDSPHKGVATFDSVHELAGEGLGFDPGGHRREFLELVRRAKELAAAREAPK